MEKPIHSIRCGLYIVGLTTDLPAGRQVEGLIAQIFTDIFRLP